MHRATGIVLCALLAFLAGPASAWARAPQDRGARTSEVQAVPGGHGSGLGLAPGKLFRDLARALATRRDSTPQRSGQPRGGKANLERIHTERYGEGSVSGREREWGTLTAAEREFARELAVRGFHVKLIPERRDRKTPDFLVNGMTIELKTLQSFGKNTVRNALDVAIGQNPDIFIINCRNVPARIEPVKQQIRSVERAHKISLEGKVIVWMPDGSVYTH